MVGSIRTLYSRLYKSENQSKKILIQEFKGSLELACDLMTSGKQLSIQLFYSLMKLGKQASFQFSCYW
jgi:hypothetical protein